MHLSRPSNLRSIARRAAATVTVLIAATVANAQRLPVPNVIGPLDITSTPGTGQPREYPQLASEPYFDLRDVGYTEEEFFVEGFATRYQTPALANAVAVSSGHPYKTRLVVHRPVDPSKFNGIVLVEWVNVTSGYGIDLHWEYSKEYLTREGYVHVAVQAQRVGIHQPSTGLKDWSPTRYGSLDLTAGGTVTDDSLSYDVFSQVAAALKGFGRSQLIGNLKPKAYFAIGQSQSASRLTLYYNSVQPLHKVYDGFLIQVGGGPFRTDVRAPMIQVLSEVELPSSAARRQPDSDTLRIWEIAGASHVDYWWIMYRQALAVRDGLPPPNLTCRPEVGSHVPMRYVLNAGYDHLTRWVLRNNPPPPATPIVVTSVGPPAVIARDGNGIALGGIRQADVEAPIATNRGDQPGITPGCSNLYGQHVAFDEGKLAQLYPTHADYVRAVTQAVRDNVRDGFVLKEDAEEIIRRARNSSVATGRPLPIQ